jgi:hypothetical protein
MSNPSRELLNLVKGNKTSDGEYILKLNDDQSTLKATVLELIEDDYIVDLSIDGLFYKHEDKENDFEDEWGLFLK